MLFDNSCDCTHYYQCQQQAGSEDWTFVEEACAPGTAFNPDMHICDFPANVPGCEDAGY